MPAFCSPLLLSLPLSFFILTCREPALSGSSIQGSVLSPFLRTHPGLLCQAPCHKPLCEKCVGAVSAHGTPTTGAWGPALPGCATAALWFCGGNCWAAALGGGRADRSLTGTPGRQHSRAHCSELNTGLMTTVTVAGTVPVAMPPVCAAQVRSLFPGAWCPLTWEPEPTERPSGRGGGPQSSPEPSRLVFPSGLRQRLEGRLCAMASWQ